MFVEEFYNIVRSVVGSSEKSIALHEPSFDSDDLICVKQTVESGWVSYQGEMVQKFEQHLAAYLKMPYVISVVNGSSALFVSLKSLDIGQNDEVLVPSLTFAATANAVCHVGATPHFVDSCKETLGVDLDKLEKYLKKNTFLNENKQLINKKTNHIIKAIIPVYIFGTAFNIDRLQQIAKKFNLQIIEDAAEALGSNYGEQKISALTGVGVLSFNGNKIITTGGGGAVVTKDENLAERVRHISTTAKKLHRYEFEHDEIGYNLRLPAINAALGYSQLKKIDIFLSQKRKLHDHYKKEFSKLNIGKIFSPDLFGKSNCWLNAFILNEEKKHLKNQILEYLNNHKIAARPLWKPLHLLDIYSHFPRSDCSTTQNLYNRIICLPSSPGIKKNG